MHSLFLTRGLRVPSKLAISGHWPGARDLDRRLEFDSKKPVDYMKLLCSYSASARFGAAVVEPLLLPIESSQCLDAFIGWVFDQASPSKSS